MDINISKKDHHKIFIVPFVKFWWMDEKWHQRDIMVVVIGELHNKTEKQLLRLSCTKMRSYIQWVAFLVIHATFPITLMGVEIQWVANGHCNSKIEL
jgi:hypothetical protein